MSYLSQPTSKTEYGVTLVGDYINVTDGIISLEQDVSPDAAVTFLSLDITDSLFADGELVLTDVIPSSGNGIALTNVTKTGYTKTFTISNTGVLSATAAAGISIDHATGNITISNTGVLSLTAGPGITLSGSTGNITVSATGADLIHVYGTTTSYTVTNDDEYVGVSSTNAVTITLPAGVPGRVYYIKDEYGQGSGKITIQPQSGELIDGKSNYVISVPYQCVSCVFRAGAWRLI